MHINDFGIAKDMNEKNKIMTTVGSDKGTTAYMAPEYLSRDREQQFVNYNKLDVWAIGVISYQIATLRLPFSGPNSIDIQQNIIRSEPD